MTQLFCNENKLTALDASQNPKLTILDCSNNELTTIDVSNNTALESVECSGNRLTNMDLTANSLIQDFNGDEQTYDIAVYNNTMTFDLKSLPGNFDPLKSSEWKGASVEGNTLKLESKKPSEVTYAYEVRPGRKKLLVTLKISYKDKVKIHFDKNGGMGTMSDVTLDKDSSYTLPSCDFTAPKNKEFKAWLAGDEEKNAGDVITVDADTTLKALWKDKEVTPGTNPENPPLNPDTDPNQPGATTHTEGNGNTSKNVEAPKTGDNSALPFYSLLLFVSASGFFALKRKTGKEQ